MTTEPVPVPDEHVDLSDALICPFCGKLYRPGELICQGCGNAFTQAGKTRLMELPDDVAPAPKNRHLYAGLLAGIKPMIFEIDGNRITLPARPELVVGRVGSADGCQPEVDLGPFAAEEKGVSRLHMRINHRNALTYITDLGSLNGTWLNGFCLVPHVERLLRDGDSLRLGKLAIKVIF